MRYLRKITTRPVLYASALAGSVGLALASAALAFAVTQPTVSYRVFGNCAGDGGCQETVTIDANPNNAAIRAWAECSDFSSYEFGGWHTSVGATSTTPSCPSGRYVFKAGFDFNRTQVNRVQCYVFGNAKTGFC